jgi:hypothetical protein
MLVGIGNFWRIVIRGLKASDSRELTFFCWLTNRAGGFNSLPKPLKRALCPLPQLPPLKKTPRPNA